MKTKRKYDKTANAETTDIVRMGNTLCRILKNCKEVKQGKGWSTLVDCCTGDTFQVKYLTKPKTPLGPQGGEIALPKPNSISPRL